MNYKLNTTKETQMKASKNDMKKAIISKCVECNCGERSEAKLCHIEKCPLWSISRSFFGVETETKIEKKVSTRKPMSDEHKAKLKAGREAAKASKK